VKKHLKVIVLFWLIGLASLIGGSWVYALPTGQAGQNREVVDSLENLLVAVMEDGRKLKILNKLSREYSIKSPKQSLKYATEALELARQLKDTIGISESLNNLGSAEKSLGNYKEALEHYEHSIQLLEKKYSDSLKSSRSVKRAYAHTNANMGILFMDKGDYEKALDHMLKALKISEEIDEKQEVSNLLNNIGSIFFDQQKFDDARTYYLKSLAINEKLGNKDAMSTALGNIGITYGAQENLDKAEEYFLEQLRITEQSGNKNGISTCLGNLGILYTLKEDYKQALKYMLKGLELAEEMEDKRLIAYSYENIGMAYVKLGEVEKAIEYQEKGLEMAKEMGAKPILKSIYQNIAANYAKLKRFEHAYEYHQLYAKVKDSLFNEESSRQITEMQTKYETEKKEKEIELLTKDNEIKDLAVSKQKLLRNSLIAGLVLALAMAFLLYNRYRLKQKANALLEEKNRYITDSINYASRIQTAILPPDELIKEHLPDSFILFKPKDIVSGDFYWLSQKNNMVFIVAADCTGHGVPGAFMSMIGNTLLNETINEKGITDPSAVLDHLNQGIIKALRQRGEDADTMDGMDMALCAFTPLGSDDEKVSPPKDERKTTLEFAGAKRPLFHISGGELNKLNGGTQSIGGRQEENFEKFTTHRIIVKAGDTFYISSDGYVDQFGGPTRKKFLTARLQALLLDSQHLSMHEQGNLLDKTIEEWKSDLEQIDDILIIGVRV